MKRPFPLSKVHYLLGSGPVIMVSTVLKGRNNVMPMSWHTMIDYDPPLIGCIISDKSLTFRNLKAAKECVISIPTVKIAKKMLACGDVTGTEVDKFVKFGLTPEKASAVKAPLIKECYADLECKLVDASMSGKYNLFIFKVVKAWVDASIKNPKTMHASAGNSFIIAGKPVKLTV